MTDPHVVAWTDQFGALLRDECRKMLKVIVLTGWDKCATIFNDPYDDDKWRLEYWEGECRILNLSNDQVSPVVLDLEALGVLS